jgi:hypothetical protein
MHDVNPELLYELRRGVSLPPLCGEHLSVVKRVEAHP